MRAPADHWGLVGQDLAGRYRVERLVEEGGFGVIYRGIHLALKRPVAIKVLKNPPDLSQRAVAAFVENFTLEAQTVARLSHPNIVQVLDFGVSDMARGGRAPWMVLEWLDGKPLSKFLRARRGQSYAPPDALALMRPVLEALSHAHDEHMAHRDIKPANIMLVETKRGPVPKLLDFGIAKVMEAEERVGTGHTQTQGVFQAFSPKYASPEQLSRARTGPWTDVHAMGLILTELLTGRPAFVHDPNDTTALYSQVLSPTWPTPRAKGFDVGVWEPVLARAMALRPPDRYRDAGEFLAALAAEVPAQVTGGPTGVDASASAPDPVAASWASESEPQVQAQPQSSAGQGGNGTTLSGSALVTLATAQTPPPRGRPWAMAGVVLVLLGAGVGAGVMIARRSVAPAAVPVPASSAAARLAAPSAQSVPAVAVVPSVPAVAAAPSVPAAPAAPAVPVVAVRSVSVDPPAAANNAQVAAPAAQQPAVGATEPASATAARAAGARPGAVRRPGHHGGSAATRHQRMTIE
jgi:serine/threonine protein kinase